MQEAFVAAAAGARGFRQPEKAKSLKHREKPEGFLSRKAKARKADRRRQRLPVTGCFAFLLTRKRGKKTTIVCIGKAVGSVGSSQSKSCNEKCRRKVSPMN